VNARIDILVTNNDNGLLIGAQERGAKTRFLMFFSVVFIWPLVPATLVSLSLQGAARQNIEKAVPPPEK